jgi:very-short-patch-repair endonuclease
MLSNVAKIAKTTICEGEGCGKKLSYKSRKPKLCPACRRKKPGAAPKSRTPKTSKKELLVSRLMMEIFPDLEVIHNGYYSWLRSPKSQPMQLDVYVPELRVAIEYDGRQHSVFSEYMFGAGKAGQARFKYLQDCDQLKDALCLKAGILLLRIRHDRTVTKGYMLRRLENEDVLSKARLVTKVNEEGDVQDG